MHDHRRRRALLMACGLACFLAVALTGLPAADPRPKVIKLDPQGKGYLRLLGGPPETSTMRSGLVTLAAGASVGKHNTEGFEELMIVLEGEGEMRVTGGGTFRLAEGTAAYCPSRTEHDVANTGTKPLRYIYVVADAKQ
ncbi:MAG TPA: cupin domain-containing protein [Terriglobales bacterium]|nr:cupin domain-containing protein [Terriglobales bacterium]